MRLALKLVGSVKQNTFSNVAGHCPTYGGPFNRTKRWRKGGFIPCLPAWAGTSNLIFSWPWTEICTIDSPGSPMDWDGNYIARLSWVTSLQAMGLLSLHNHLSQFFIINTYISIYLYISPNLWLVRFLWGTLTNTGTTILIPKLTQDPSNTGQDEEWEACAGQSEPGQRHLAEHLHYL